MAEHRVTYQDANGVRRTLILDDERPNRVVVHTEQVLDEILAGVQRRRELMRQGGHIRHLAQMPVDIYERSVHERWGPDDDAKMAQGVAQAEAEPFRIWKGRVLMCGFGIGTIFQVAIFVVVVLVVLALLRILLGDWFAGLTGAPYWNIIRL